MEDSRNRSAEIRKLNLLFWEADIAGCPYDDGIQTHAAILVLNGWPPEEAIAETVRAFAEAELEDGMGP